MIFIGEVTGFVELTFCAPFYRVGGPRAGVSLTLGDYEAITCSLHGHYRHDKSATIKTVLIYRQR